MSETVSKFSDHPLTERIEIQNKQESELKTFGRRRFLHGVGWSIAAAAVGLLRVEERSSNIEFYRQYLIDVLSSSNDEVKKLPDGAVRVIRSLFQTQDSYIVHELEMIEDEGITVFQNYRLVLKNITEEGSELVLYDIDDASLPIDRLFLKHDQVFSVLVAPSELSPATVGDFTNEYIQQKLPFYHISAKNEMESVVSDE